MFAEKKTGEPYSKNHLYATAQIHIGRIHIDVLLHKSQESNFICSLALPIL